MEKALQNMKESLVACVQSQMTHLDTIDAKELGEAIDMIKDLEEAIYYCTVTKAMHEKGYAGNSWSEQSYYSDWMSERDMDRPYGRMYYSDGRYSSTSGHNHNESAEMYPMGKTHDHREGTSPEVRRRYMEAKESHKDKNVQLKELENYVKELSKDVVDMIEDATSEEKKYLATKISALATKIQTLDA